MTKTAVGCWLLAVGKAGLLVLLGVSVSLCAAELPVNMSVENAVLQKIRARMTARAPKLEEWKDAGAIGEGAGGKIESHAAAAEPSMLKRKEIHDLIAAENEDRATLFHEILLANGLAESELNRVVAAFTAARHEAAKQEHWFKVEDHWMRKKDL
jgi:hypothetical protein